VAEVVWLVRWIYPGAGDPGIRDDAVRVLPGETPLDVVATVAEVLYSIRYTPGERLRRAHEEWDPGHLQVAEDGRSLSYGHTPYVEAVLCSEPRVYGSEVEETLECGGSGRISPTAAVDPSLGTW